MAIASATVRPMASFDVVSEVDEQEVKNAVDQAQREIANRYDFKNTNSSIELNELTITMHTASEDRLNALRIVVEEKLVKRGVSLRGVEYGDVQEASQNTVRQVMTIAVGISQEKSKLINRTIKEKGPKGVSSQVQGDSIRVQAKKRDALAGGHRAPQGRRHRHPTPVPELPRLARCTAEQPPTHPPHRPATPPRNCRRIVTESVTIRRRFRDRARVLRIVSAASGQTGSMRVLVVDDEVRLAESIARGLAAEGFDTDVVHDGVDALWRAREADYAAIVLDIMLPGKNGYEVCRELRADGVTTPILMLTAKDGEYDEAEGLDTGADDYLRKPFSFVVLVARLRALLRRGPGIDRQLDHRRRLHLRSRTTPRHARRTGPSSSRPASSPLPSSSPDAARTSSRSRTARLRVGHRLRR